jgi:type II secretory pathway pseudopilin PulG
VRRRPGPAGRAGGFTFIGILLAVAFLGIALAAVGTVWATAVQRDREAELLFVGKAYRDAIRSYYVNGSGAARYPNDIQDLIEDRRFPAVRRHLRRIYADPMTGSPDWEFIRTVDGAIMGVRSSSRQKPIKRANFGADDLAFAGAECYCDWQFVFQARRTARPVRKP